MHHVRLVAASLISPLAFLTVACGGTTADQSAQQSSGSNNEAPQTTLTKQGTPPAESTKPADPKSTGPVEVETTIVASGLEVPWGIAFLPNGDALVTERDSGRVLSLDSSGNTKEIQTLPSNAFGEGGLLGIALSPSYKNDGLVYAYCTTTTDNRVVHFRRARTPNRYSQGFPLTPSIMGAVLLSALMGTCASALETLASATPLKTSTPYPVRS